MTKNGTVHPIGANDPEHLEPVEQSGVTDPQETGTAQPVEPENVEFIKVSEETIRHLETAAMFTKVEEDGTVSFRVFIRPETPEHHTNMVVEMVTTVEPIGRTLKSLTPEMVANPYRDEVYSLFSGENEPLKSYRGLLFSFENSNDKKRLIDVSGGAIPLLRELINKIETDHSGILDAIANGEINPDHLGLTKDDLVTQHLNRIDLETDARYAFLVDLVRRGVWPVQNKEYHRRKSGNKTTPSTGLFIANDHLTNALARRGDNHIRPQDYFSGEYVKVNSGLGGHTNLLVTTESDIDEVYENYQISDRFRYWADAFYALAFENPGEPIRGTEILERNAYANPYNPSASATIEDAAKNLDKGIKTRIATDVSNEVIQGKKKKAYKRTQAIRLQPIIDGKITIEEWTDENTGKGYKDFSITLNGSPEECLPLANLAAERGQLQKATEDEITFHTVRKLDTDDRQIWRYVLRQIKEKKTRNTIYFSTMWSTLELREPEYLKPVIDESGNPVEEIITDKNDQPVRDKDGKVKTKPKTETTTYQDAINQIRVNPKLKQETKRKQIAALERKRKIAINSQRNRKLKKLESMLDEAQTDSGIDCYSKKKEVITFPKKIESWQRVTDSKGKWIGVKVTPLRKEETTEEEPIQKEEKN